MDFDCPIIHGIAVFLNDCLRDYGFLRNRLRKFVIALPDSLDYYNDIRSIIKTFDSFDQVVSDVFKDLVSCNL